MGLLDLLLGTSADKLKERPTGKVRINRLSELSGGDFVLELRALSLNELDGMPSEDRTLHIVAAGVTNLDFGNGELRERLKPEGRKTPLTPVEAVQALLLPGEISGVYLEISRLSGFGDGMVETIEKN